MATGELRSVSLPNTDSAVIRVMPRVDILQRRIRKQWKFSWTWLLITQ